MINLAENFLSFLRGWCRKNFS